MTLLYSKARELFDQDYKNSPEGQTQEKSKGLKRTRSGKVLLSFRKQNKRK
ncbi:hypothetical protein QRD89_01495 [Halobacillus sp. ACCC02827]|uniref:hypothetical protein n=1 Tax=Bacillaceae TaxID=186817 RepID=UPI0002A50A24|nr:MULTISPECIES: hypothetical protein [Bacillaceae]ELK46709.1 hypothetical protein D479_09701 [Halobacillus sp. BAB-2008]WJE16069.1 hypothetical protein QRD89_01495 [Halobacillus sp. ACCC02827]